MTEAEDRDSEEDGSDCEERASEDQRRSDEDQLDEGADEGLEEDFTGEEPSGADPKAVEVSKLLCWALEEFLDANGDPLPEGNRKYASFTKEKLVLRTWQTFLQHLREFCNAVLDAMNSLPASPGRQKLNEEDCKALRALFRPVQRSFTDAKHILEIACHASRARCATRLVPSYMITKYISGYEPYTKYKALDSWLFRRTDAYQKWARSYYRRPAVCARKAKNRPDKKAEAERKRRAYYASQGILEPPPRRVKGKNAADPEVDAEEKPMLEPAVDAPTHTATAATRTSEPTPIQTAVSDADMTPLSVLVESGAGDEPPVANATPEVITDMFENK